MKEHSSEFKENLLNIGREVDSIVTIGNTTLHDELYSANIVYDGGILKSVMKELDLESSVDIEKGTILNFKTGIKVDDSYEYLDYGNFVVFSSERQEDERNYKIVCYDKMLYAMKDYEDTEVTYPISVRDYIKAICDKLELDFANEDEEFANYDKILLNEKYLNTDGDSIGYTYRDVLDELAQVTASTICINNQDELEIRYVQEIPTINETATGTFIELDDSIDHKIANASIDGRMLQDTTNGYQLLKNSNTNSGDNNYWYSYDTFDETTRTLTRKVTTTSEGFISHRVGGLEQNSTYTMSLYAKSNGYVRSMDLYCFNENIQGIKYKGPIELTTEFQKYTWTFTTASDVEYGSGSVIRIDNNGTTQSGTEAILTIKDVMLEKGSTAHDYEEYTGGQASPNPDYIQKVKITTGTQEIKVSNKNMLEIKEGEFAYSNYINWKVENGLVYLSVNNIEEQGGALNLINGSTSRWASGTIKDYNITSNGGKYTFSIYKNGTITKGTSGNVILYIYKYKNDGSYSYSYFGININDITNYTITLQDDEHIGDIILYSQYIECENVEFKMQLEKGNRATEYIQHQGKRRNLHLSSRNVCLTDPSEWTIGHWGGTGIWDATNTRAGIHKLIPVPENTTLYVTTNAQNYNFVLRGYDKNGDFIVSYGGKANGATIQTIYNGIKIAYLGIAIYKWTGETSTTGQEILNKITSGEIKPFICLNSETDKTYDDYWNYELAKIGDYKNKIAESTGKNIYNPNYRRPDNNILCYHGTCTEENGMFTATANATDMYIWNVINNGNSYSLYQCDLYDFEENSYTVTITNPSFTKNYITFFDNNKISLGYKNFSTNTFTFTKGDVGVPSNAKYFGIRFGVGNSVAGTTYKTYVQIEAGITATEFEPYGNNWYIEKNIKKALLNGVDYNAPGVNTPWDNNHPGYIHFQYPSQILTKYTGQDVLMIMCDRFQSVRIAQRNLRKEQVFSHFTNGVFSLTIKQDRLGSDITATSTTAKKVTALNNWLSSNYTTLYFVMQNTQYEIITNEQLIAELNDLKQMLTYKGKTLIDITGDLAGNLNVEYATGYDDSYIVDERQLKDVNVDFGEKYGPINSIVLSRGGADNVYLQDEESTAINGLHEIKITDNQIMNGNDRDEYLPDILEKLDGLEYYTNDFTSPGICYLDLCDRYKVQAHGNEFDCVLFNDEINIDQGIEENIHTELPEEAQTDYSKADKTDRKINQTTFVVDKHEQQIQSLITQVGDRSDKQTSITQDIDKIELAVEDLEDLTFEVEGTNPITLEECVAGELLTLRIKGNNTVFDSLKPSNTLVPSDTLYPYGDSILILKHYTENEQHEIVETIERIDLGITQPLRYMSASVFDEFRYDYDTEQKAKVIRRIGLTNNGEMYQLQQEVIEPVDIDDIILTQGTNIIDIGAPYQATIYADYVKQNQFTKIFTTQYQVSTQILQLANQISLIVAEKVDQGEIIAKINLAVENEQGIITIFGNQIQIDSDNFHMSPNGTIEINNEAHRYDYDTEDVYLMINYILEEQELPEGLLKIYDYNNDNVVNIVDVAQVTEVVQGERENEKVVDIDVSIDPNKPNEIISLSTSTDLKTTLGLKGISTWRLHGREMFLGENEIDMSTHQINDYGIYMDGDKRLIRMYKEDNVGEYGIELDAEERRITLYNNDSITKTIVDTGQVDAYNVYASANGTNPIKGHCMHGIDNKAHTYACNWDNSRLTFYVDNNASGYVSDRRLKTDIKDIDSKLIEAISDLEFHQFIIKNRDGRLSVGVIAQELLELFDKYNINADDYGFVYEAEYSMGDETKYYFVDYEQLLILQSAGLKQQLKKQQEDIDYLKEEIKKLKGEK